MIDGSLPPAGGQRQLARPDLTACDREPIHIPGSIQPHGLLLVADAASREVVAGAGDIENRLAPDWMGRTLDDLLGQNVGAALARTDEPGRGSLVLDRVERHGTQFDIVVHASGDHLLVELELETAREWPAARTLSMLEATTASFERSTDLVSLCEAAAAAFRTLTGFDRVMIYRFLDDDAGVVLAEDRAEGEHSFLNHHFPATDIPQQARALYVRNRVRIIPDVRYEPAPLRPAAARDIDLSDVALRSVSPIHLEYLRNMDVGASASMSIVKDGLLWGLVACHHRTPHSLPIDLRLACAALAGDLARQIRAKENAGNYRERIRLRAAEDRVVTRLGGDASLGEFFEHAGGDVCRMLDADGFVAIQGKDIYVSGICPPQDALFAIGEHFKHAALAQPVATASLETILDKASAWRDCASGLLAATMSTEEPTIMMWFRAEQPQVVEWAGNPHASDKSDPNAVLTPRASFDAWSETVRGRARPWTREEIEAANRLKRTMFEARQNRRLRELNRDLAATIADKESLLAQKDYLMGEVNHRVQNSLQLVSAFLAMQARAANEPAVSDHLDEAQRRLQAVALVHRRLYADDRVEAVDLGRYIEDLVTELTTSMGREWRDQLRMELAPILISTDRAVNVGLILTELVINANKYAYDGDAGPIEITLEQYRQRFRLVVADRGKGKASSGRGFGTRMLKAMIERLGGDMTEDSSPQGLRVILSAPIEAD
ncbi:MAG: histidine kinase dimerization/phosphoacceptor domain -containing protein [Sphingomonas sp.]